MELYLILALLAAVVIGVAVFLRKAKSTGDSAKPATTISASAGPAASNTTTNNKNAEAKANRPSMKIFFGSQSGTAETYAQELSEEASRHGFASEVVDLDDYDPEQLADETFAVFLVATFGEGDPTDNAAAFQDWLMEQEVGLCNLEQVTFAVFALGNRQYEHYCAVGRRFDTRFEELGGTRLLALGEGDDDGSLEDDYTAWKEKFWARAHETFQTKTEPLDASAAAAAFQPSWEVEWLEGGIEQQQQRPPQVAERKSDIEDEDEEEDDAKLRLENDGVEMVAQVSPILHKQQAEVATLVLNKELRKDTQDGSTRLFALDISQCSFSYRTADNLEIMPKNHPRLVRRLAERLGLQLDSKFAYKPVDPEAGAAESSVARKSSSAGQETPEHRLQKKMGMPLQLTVRNALGWFMDFTAVPRSKGLQVMAHYAKIPEERRRLEWLANDPEGRQEMQTTQKGLMRLLMEFKSVEMPWAAFLEICPRLQPRMYTISSSNLVKPTTVELTVVLSSEKLSWGTYDGVCSSYLTRLHHGHQVCVSVRQSSFQLPKDRSQPVIMVGPGTGIAPFRAFIQEFAYLKKQQEQESAEAGGIPPLVLYFGCRYKNRDFIFEEELVQAHEEAVLEAVHVAFSRDTPTQVYVTDLIPRHAQQLWGYLQEHKAHIYVCGSPAMGRGVQKAFVRVCEAAGNLSTAQAEAFVTSLQNDRRYIQELWS